MRGVIMNRVDPKKMETTKTYIEKALAQWGVPLIGCGCSSVQDFFFCSSAPLMHTT